MPGPKQRIWALAIVLAATCCRAPRSVSLVPLAASREVAVDGDSRSSFVPAFPARLDFDLELPPRPTLRFAVAVAAPRRAERARVDFAVRVTSENGPTTVFRKTLRADEHNVWHDADVDLAAWSERHVTLRLETSPTRAEAPVPWAERIQTIWGEPHIVEGEPVDLPENASMILIVVDTLRHDYLGIHGFDGDISPNLDWLALESVRFDEAFAPAPWTKPSVATLLTGLHPQTHGVRDQGGRILPEATDTLSEQANTLAEVYRAQGYETVAFVGNAWLAPPYGFEQGFDTYIVDNRDERIVERARAWLASRSDDAPYFLYLHFINVHGPYRAPERDYLELRDSRSLGEDRALDADAPSRPRHLEATPWADAEEKTRLRPWKAKYAAAVRQLDRRLGALLGELRRSGELDRAWVVFTSDHGEEFLEHGNWEHGYALCAHQIHVPLWIRAPGARFAGRRISSVTSLVDVMPTILGASSIPVPDEVQGVDRSAWLRDDAPASPPERSSALSSGILNRPEVHSLRTGRYHLLWDEPSNEIELFDVRDDPEEQRNVAANRRELATRLHRLLESRLEQIASAGNLETEVVPIPDELRERLRALGYIE